MDKRKYYSDIADEEITVTEENSSLDDWIQPEMLRRCSTKYKSLMGETKEDYDF